MSKSTLWLSELMGGADIAASWLASSMASKMPWGRPGRWYGGRAIDTLMTKVRYSFHRAWELDSSAGSAVTDCREGVEDAIVTLRKVLG